MRAKRITVGDLAGLTGKSLEVRRASAINDGNVHLAAYVDAEAPGAFRNGTRLAKVVKEAGDTHEIGAMATVIGSLGPMPAGQQYAGEHLYCVEWDDRPGVPVFVRAPKMARVD